MTDLLSAEPRMVFRTTGSKPQVIRDGDGLTIEGYIARFGEKIMTSDWGQPVEEEIAPGAFSKSISERTPIMLFNHGRGGDQTGMTPIGVWSEVFEDRKGLFGRGRMFGNDLVAPVREAIEAGAVTGQSFMAEPMVMEPMERRGKPILMMLRELRLIEGGPVTFPAYSSTSVSVRSLFGAQPTAEPLAFEDDLAAFRWCIENIPEDVRREALARAEATPSGAGNGNEPPPGHSTSVAAPEPPDMTETMREYARIMGRRYPGDFQ